MENKKMSFLAKATKGRKRKPFCAMFYGVHGIGKSSLAEEFPESLVIGPEENDELDNATRLEQVSDWDMFIAQLREVATAQHGFKTVFIDTLDMLEQFAQKKILEGQPSNVTMATAFGGYGKAYERMAKMFLDVRDNYLKQIRARGINVILLAHAEKVKHEDPMTQTSWDHFKPNLHKKVSPIFEDWVSAILFANYYVTVSLDKGRETVEGEGARVIYTEERPSQVAKNRFDLPYRIPFIKGTIWKTIDSHMSTYFVDNKIEVDVDLLAQAREMAAKVEDKKLSGTIEVSISKAKNDEELKRIITKIEGLS